MSCLSLFLLCIPSTYRLLRGVLGVTLCLRKVSLGGVPVSFLARLVRPSLVGLQVVVFADQFQKTCTTVVVRELSAQQVRIGRPHQPHHQGWWGNNVCTLAVVAACCFSPVTLSCTAAAAPLILSVTPMMRSYRRGLLGSLRSGIQATEQTRQERIQGRRTNLKVCALGLCGSLTRT